MSYRLHCLWRKLWPSDNRNCTYVPGVRKRAKIYRIGGGWGSRVRWKNYDTFSVVGWKHIIPMKGDFLLAPMASGRTGVFIFNSVRAELDPPDMFFGTVRPIGYEDEERIKNMLAHMKVKG